MTTPRGYKKAEWSDLHEGDWIYIAKRDPGGYSYVTTKVQVVDPLEHTVTWYKREHYDYGKDADMVAVVTPLEQAWRGGFADWPGIIRVPYLRIYPEGYRQATQDELRDGHELYVWAVEALGPFDPVSTTSIGGRITSMRLRNRRNGRTFLEPADTIMVCIRVMTEDERAAMHERIVGTFRNPEVVLHEARARLTRNSLADGTTSVQELQDWIDRWTDAAITAEVPSDMRDLVRGYREAGIEALAHPEEPDPRV